MECALKIIELSLFNASNMTIMIKQIGGCIEPNSVSMSRSAAKQRAEFEMQKNNLTLV